MPIAGTAIPALSFRLNGKMHTLAACVCLYRAVDPASMTTTYLLLTKDRRFAHLGRVIGGKGKGLQAADEWSPDRAMRYLLEHGEGDIVDEFPDIFRKRPQVRSLPAKEKKIAAPKDRPTEPYLFPLQ